MRGERQQEIQERNTKECGGLPLVRFGRKRILHQQRTFVQGGRTAKARGLLQRATVARTYSRAAHARPYSHTAAHSRSVRPYIPIALHRSARTAMVIQQHMDSVHTIQRPYRPYGTAAGRGVFTSNMS